MAVLIKIRHTTQSPVRWKRWTEHGVNDNVVIKVRDRCLAGAGITQHKIGVAIAIKIAYGSPASQADFHKPRLAISDREASCLRRKRRTRNCVGVRPRWQHSTVSTVRKRC